MKFKKIVFLRMVCFLAFFLGVLQMRSYAFNYNQEAGAKSSQVSNEKFSRGRIFGNDVLCMETFELFPETEFLNENKEKLYKRVLKIIKEFRTLKKGDFKSAAQWEFEFNFIYDKKNLVEIENPDEDICIQKSKSKWSIMDLKEVFPDGNICLVSVKSVLYKENILGLREYITDGHADIFCSVMGNIGINTDLH